MARSRSGSLLVAAAGILALHGCGSTPAKPQPCTTSSECSPSSRCISQTCVANAPPVADIALPAGALEANALLAFDGSASADPDPGDSIASRAWGVRAVAAGCAPPVVAGNGPVAQVRFACPGTYAVDLAVKDQLGAEGTATKEVQVLPYSGPPLLTLGPDVSVGHACTAGPAYCTTAGAVDLSVAPTADAPPNLTLLWSVEPPAGLPLDANRRVAFSPGADAPAPSVTIETDGQAISGDWIFHVDALDAIGVVASGAVRVSIGNTAPVIARTIPVPDHAFDGAQLTASGEVPFTVTDADGDALVGPTVAWHHLGDGPSGAFTGTVLDAPARVTFAIVVPYAAPPDALYLRGGTGLERSVSFSVSDVNGAVASEVWPITVGNRPPVLVSEPTGVVVDHGYDAAGLAYQAIAPLSTWSDPDGDPLMAVLGAGTGDPQCPQLDVVGGVSTASCSLAFTGTPAVANFAGTHLVAQHVQDPWDAAATASTVSFTIANRPPSIATTPVVVRSACSTGACCQTQRDPGTGIVLCVAWTKNWSPGSTTATGLWLDADGDPLYVTVASLPPSVCTPDTCSMTFTFSGTTTCASPAPSATYASTASDGASTASGDITMNVACL